MKPLALGLCAAALGLVSGCATAPRSPHGPMAAPGAAATRAPGTAVTRDLWINLVRAGEASADDVLAELAAADVVYVGEMHTNARHHALQMELLQQLFLRKVPLVLCLEQLEARDQPAIDRYNRRELDFDALAREIDWAKKWRNFPDYRALCEFARAHGIPVRALNAPAATIRAVSRGGGLAKLAPELRADLPPDIGFDDPAYERLVTRELAIHMALDPEKLRPVYEAQVARDEAMAAQVVAARRVDPPAGRMRTALVVTGAGHMRHGLGVPDRVRRREPGVVDRLVLATEGDPRTVSAEEKAQTREITLTHAELRATGRPPADFLRVLAPAAGPVLPPGHPPLPR